MTLHRPASRRDESPEERPGRDQPAELILRPSRRQRLGDQLYGQILDQIMSGRLKEGDRLPPEKEICDIFGVSRPIVREALIRLRADGLLHARQGAGTFVMARPAERLASLTRAEAVAELMRSVEVRLPLEGTIARLAAERRTDDQLAAIVDAHAALQREADAGAMTPASDFRFHASIAAATGNDLFPLLLERLEDAMSGFMRLSLALTRTGSKERARIVLAEHAEVLNAVVAQEAESAKIAMQYHIGQARRRMIDGKRDP